MENENPNQTNQQTVIHLSGRAVEDSRVLSEAILARWPLQLCNLDNQLFWIEGGALSLLGTQRLAALLAHEFVTPRPEQDANGNWSMRLVPVSVDPRQLLDTTDEVLKRLGKHRGSARDLSPQQLSEIRLRSRQGEHPAALAKAYGVPEQFVKAVR